MAFLHTLWFLIFLFSFSIPPVEAKPSPFTSALETSKSIVRVTSESGGIFKGKSRAFIDKATGKLLISRTVRPVYVREEGYGIMVDSSGLIACASHSVRGETRITVTLPDGKKEQAKVAEIFPENDLAFLKIEHPEALSEITFADTQNLQVGSPVYWIKASGVGYQVKKGLVTDHGNSTDDPETATKVRDLIKVNFLVKKGDSGGPLLDKDGKVLGIILAGSGRRRSTFALPAHAIQKRLEEYLAKKPK